MVKKLFYACSSLKLTVVLLVLGCVLVFWGTLVRVHVGLYKAQNEFFRERHIEGLDIDVFGRLQKTMKWTLLILLGFVSCWQVSADPPFPPDAVLLTRWIVGQQYHDTSLSSYGAIRSEEGAAATGTNGLQYYSVSPYSANLAVMGLLQARAPNGVRMAEVWIDWYFNHLDIQSAPDARR
jgi:hypothetical protein